MAFFFKLASYGILFFIIGYINLWSTYAIFSELFNGFSLVWYSTLSTFVIYLNETVEGSTCLISKTSLIKNKKINYFANYILEFINCRQNA